MEKSGGSGIGNEEAGRGGGELVEGNPPNIKLEQHVLEWKLIAEKLRDTAVRSCRGVTGSGKCWTS
jgi:hypothetical protein